MSKCLSRHALTFNSVTLFADKQFHKIAEYVRENTIRQTVTGK